MDRPIENMRIHLYGVQGSGSTFPGRPEREAMQELMDYQLLKCVFEDLGEHLDEDGHLTCTLQDVLGGEIRKKTLRNYRQRFKIPQPRIYGGWTTSVHIETADNLDLVLDCGSGFRNCALNIQNKWGDRKERHLHIFGTHSHVDHTEGFDLAAVCFDPRNFIHIYANAQFLSALDSYLGIFSRHVDEEVKGVQTPVYYSLMPAQFEGIEIRDSSKSKPSRRRSSAHRIHPMEEGICLGETRVTAFWVYHPAPCLAYKIERAGKKFVFCTDHELRHGLDPDDPRQTASRQAEDRLRKHAEKADVLYRDGQYLRSEYDGHLGIGSSAAVPRLDWGHSCLEDVEEMAVHCAVKQTFIGHHDPNRSWNECNWLDESLARRSKARAEKVELARAEISIDL
jgi:phosphoribosyl 1,2-cyclic phosphodiesterase